MKQTYLATLALAALMAAAPLAAQEVQRIDGPAVPCPHPVSTVIKGSAHPPTPNPADFPPNVGVAGSVWNQTQADKHFGHTFKFPAPGRECCVWTSATLVVTIKALQGGAFGSSSSGNDAVHLFSQGVSFATQNAWPSGATTGQTRSLTFNIPANILAKGEFSLYVQDDTAVLSADLTLRGCCLR